MIEKVLIGLLDQKAEEGRRFSKEEAAADMQINKRKRSQRELAKRWRWGQSTVSRFISSSTETRGDEYPEMNQDESNAHIYESNICVSEAESKYSESLPHNCESKLNQTDPEQEKGFLPHTPSFQKENPPSKERKPPLKGGQKKESFPPQSLREMGLFPDSGFPFTTTEAEDYFRRRLEADPSAADAGHTARDLADSFFWHWDGKNFTDPKTGKEITPKSWRARANTWWQLKDKYGGPKPKKKVFGGTITYGFQ